MDGMTLEKLQVLIEAQTKGFRDEVAKVQNEVKKMTNSVNNEVNKVKSIFKSLGRFVAAVGIGKFFVDSTRQAMKVEAAIQQITRTMGESTNQFLKWAKNNALAFNMSQSDAMNYGAVFSNLVSTFSSGTKETLQYTTDLLKASSIIASGTGRTMEDVMERIRSGLLGNTEAIEDLGVNVNVAMLKSTEAFNKFANGKSWDQLSFQTQQQIRLMAILEQTQNKFGGEVFNNTNSSLQQLVAVLKDVALNIGNAFLPILNVVLPILTGFALKLREVTAYIATFMQTLFGKKATSTVTQTMQSATSAAIGGANAQNAYNDALSNTGDTAKKTAKEMNRLLGGFDEINSLSNSGASGGGLPSASVGGADIPTIDLGLSEEPDISGVSRAAEKVRKIFKDFARFLKTNKDIVISIVGGIIAGIGSFFLITKWSKIIEGIKLGFSSLGGAISSISWPIVAIASLIALLVGNIIYLWRTNEDFRNSVIEIWTMIKDFIGQVIIDIGTILTSLWQEYGQTLVDNLKGFMESIQQIIVNIWEGVIKPIITNALEMLTWLWDNHLKGLVEELGKFIMKATNFVLELWNNFFGPIVNFLVDILSPIFISTFNLIVDSIGTAVGVISDIIRALLRTFGGLIDFISGVFSGNWSRAWQGVVDIFGGIFDGLIGIVKWPLNIIIDMINSAISGINSMIRTINKVPGVNISSVPNIPKLAKGGIVDSATIAMIGEAGKEAVVPLENNKGGLRELASILLAEMGPRNSNNNSFGDGDLILQIDGTVIGKVALKQLRKMQRQGNITLIPV